jgi:TonB family protein
VLDGRHAIGTSLSRRHLIALAAGVALSTLALPDLAYASSPSCSSGVATIERLPAALFPPGAASTYALMLSGSNKRTLDARLFISAGGTGYRAKFDGVGFSDPGGDGTGSLVSKVLVFSLPTHDGVDVAAVTAENGVGSTEAPCKPVAAYAHGADAVMRSTAPWLHEAIVKAAVKTPRIVQASPLGQVCELAFVEASTMSVVQPQVPASAFGDGAQGTVQVLLDVATDGSVASTSIYKSSGRADLDEAARKAAAASLYRPQIVACMPAPGKYLFRSDFLARPRL